MEGRRSAGMVVLRRAAGGWEVLLLRAYRHWDFPKGLIEHGETPLQAAQRETREETGLSDLARPWGDAWCATEPYARGKVACYFLALAPPDAAVHLPVNPALGRPEHHEWRWCTPIEATALLVPRLQEVLAWALERASGR